MKKYLVLIIFFQCIACEEYEISGFVRTDESEHHLKIVANEGTHSQIIFYPANPNTLLAYHNLFIQFKSKNLNVKQNPSTIKLSVYQPLNDGIKCLVNSAN